MNVNVILFKNALFMHYGVEAGTLALSSLTPFGGNVPPLSRIAQLLNQKLPESDEEIKALIEIYLRFFEEMHATVNLLSLAPGIYAVPDNLLVGKVWNWNSEDPKGFSRYMMQAVETNFKNFRTEINVTETHLAMLKNGTWQIEWQYSILNIEDDKDDIINELLVTHKEVLKTNLLYEYPTVCGDGKRPYGDLTYYYRDLEQLQITGIKADGPEKDDYGLLFSISEQQRIDKIQNELYLVAQALALYGSQI
jgi:hypothetical protein